MARAMHCQTLQMSTRGRIALKVYGMPGHLQRRHRRSGAVSLHAMVSPVFLSASLPGGTPNATVAGHPVQCRVSLSGEIGSTYANAIH
jgi:hypothetical protein